MTSVARVEEGWLDGTLGRIWFKRYSCGGAGVPILAVHGGPGFMTITEGLSELAESGRDIVFYDQFGCGKSDKPEDASVCTNDYYLSELALVRQRLGLARVHILGQSWGCMLALEHILAGVNGVESLILSAPLISSPAWATDQRKLLAAFPADMQELVARCEASGDFDTAYQNAMMTYYRRHICRLNPWPDYLVNALGQMNTDIYFNLWGRSEFTVTGSLKDVDLSDRLGEVKCPTLLVCGEYDEARAETVEGFRKLLPQGRLVVLPDAAHCHIIEQPERFRKIVMEHLQICGGL